ncbi:hypothetical protein B0H13DRAFT_618171 [Mycena leptocephala]|nr:hypothetical protein B0H13DRAFT_618171 [Mycena leptocephala]
MDALNTPGPNQAQTQIMALDESLNTGLTISPAPIPALSAQSSNFFPNSAGTSVVGSNMYAVAGDVHHHHHSLEPTSVLPPLDIIDDNFSESEVYCNQLVRRKRGVPLYGPEPRPSLPAEYRRNGVAIGDVGRLTPEGTFDFFFNIFLPADHPVNNNNVPEDFHPLPSYASNGDISDKDHDPGDHVSTLSVQMRDLGPQLNAFPGGDFVFRCRAPQGAVLALPYGSHLKKLENLETIRTYATAHAESWYKYINGPRGRRLSNGLLYLVTGWEKAQSWGIATFHSVNDEIQLVFRPTARANSPLRYQWSGNPAKKKSYDPSPINNDPLNQTVFIHGLSISLGTTIWRRLWGTVEIREIAESQLESAGRNSMSPTQGSSLLSRAFGLSSRDSATGGNHQVHSGQVILSDLSPISKIFHPGELINNYILQKVPYATVVMSHDDDWCNILGEDDQRSQVTTVSELLQQIKDQFEIVEQDGAAFLRSVSALSGNSHMCATARPHLIS